MQDPRLLQDARIIQKNDRYTLPVRSEFQHQIKGQIIERSNKRATVFIEPEAAIRLNDRLIMAKAEETAEEYQILAGLTGLLAENLTEIFTCLDVLVELDIIFARAKYCREIHGVPLEINEAEVIDLQEVRQPIVRSSSSSSVITTWLRCSLSGDHRSQCRWEDGGVKNCGTGLCDGALWSLSFTCWGKSGFHF